jgi:hypothetical protein
MNPTRWLASPLTGTAGVMAGLALLAIPLREMTSAPTAPQAAKAATQDNAAQTTAVLRLKLLDPARRIVLRDTQGGVLLDIASPAAGETEHDLRLPIHDGALGVQLSADFDPATGETAVFITVVPDGLEEQTLYATGAGSLEETLDYEWSHHH